MKFYYVAHEFNPEQPVKTIGGKRLAYYTKKHQALTQRDKLNKHWQSQIKGYNGTVLPDSVYKVFCVESEPKEIE